MTHPIDTSPEAIAALLDGVTPGPWESECKEDYDHGFEYLLIRGANEKAVVNGCGCCGSPYGENIKDIPLIAASRELVPALAAERDEARAQAKLATTLSATAYAAGFYAGVNAAVYEYEQVAGGEALVLAIDRMMAAKPPADAATALAARDAAMRNEGRRQVKVKPLVWDETVTTYTDRETGCDLPAAEFWHADSILRRGGYSIMRLVHARVKGDRESYRLELKGAVQKFADLESAKAAAQADYEARILSTLEPEGGE